MSDKLFTLTLNSPITEEQWDMITDVDLDNTNDITFHTKHGKEVKFIKASAQPEPCEDAVNRKAMRDEIDKLIKIHFDRSVVLTKAKQALFNLPSVTPKPQWIPVSERLPDEYKRVLVSDVFGVYVGEFVDAEENWGGEHFIDAHGMHSKSVKAWMPLPEPYREEGEE